MSTKKPEWYLIAVSEAAKKRGNLALIDRVIDIGRSRNNKVTLPSSLCSKLQCTITIDDSAIILEDKVCATRYYQLARF